MKRHRKFPLVSAVIIMFLGIGVAYQRHLDVDLTQKGLHHLGAATADLFASVQLIASVQASDGFTFSDSTADTPTYYMEDAQQPTAEAEPPATGDAAGSAPLSQSEMPLLVSAARPLDASYAPADLVRMRDYCDESIVKIKGSEISGERHAVDALMIMLRAAISQGTSNWQISAGYRSVKYQQELWDNKVYEYRKQGLSSSDAAIATAKYVAKPGSSEHHTGLAFDVTVPGEQFPLTPQSKWLAENCWDYGFIIRYTEEKQPITGINAEAWHVRYVGLPHSLIMRDNNWCLEEYLEFQGG